LRDDDYIRSELINEDHIVRDYQESGEREIEMLEEKIEAVVEDPS
jgi:hypothetical protein